MSMKDICDAINNRNLVQLTYKGDRREVEPHALGYDSNGNLTLCAWQTSGRSGTGWRDFHLALASHVEVLPQVFEDERPGYRRDDSTLDRIICQI